MDDEQEAEQEAEQPEPCRGCGVVKPPEEYHQAGDGRRRGDLCAACRRIWNQGRGTLRRFLLKKTPEELLEWQRRQIKPRSAAKADPEPDDEMLGEPVDLEDIPEVFGDDVEELK